jgi:hypothetical protein
MRFQRVTNRILTFVVLLLQVSCVYRFVNTSVVRRTSVRTVAVEAVYDTSRQPVPHHILWDSLQRAIAKDGHFVLASRQSADAIVRTHLYSAHVGATGRTTGDDIDLRDPTIFNPDSAVAAEFRRMDIAGRYTQRELLQMGVTIEVVDLKTGKVLMSRDYGGSKEFVTDRGAQVPDSSEFIVYEEALQNRFREISSDVTRNLVRDMLATL